MQTTFFDMKKIVCIFFVFLFVATVNGAELSERNIHIQLKSSLSFPLGQLTHFTQLTSPFLDTFVESKGENIGGINPAKQVSFRLKSFGLCFSPLLISENGSPYKKSLSFYFGTLNFSPAFKKLKTPFFTKPTYNLARISIPKPEHLSLSTGNFSGDFGLELSLPFVDLVYASTKNAKNGSYNHALFGSFQVKNVTAIESSIYTSLYFGASHGGTDYLQTTGKTVYGTSFVYTDKNIGAQTDFALSLNEQKKMGSSIAFRFQNFYKHAHIQLGLSYTSKAFSGWQSEVSDTQFCFFVIPQFSFAHTNIQFFYTLEKDNKNIRQYTHATAGKCEIKTNHLKTACALQYAKKMFSLNTSMSIYAPNTNWFKECRLEYASTFLSKKVNPYGIKQYSVACSTTFLPLKQLSITSQCKISQKNKEAERIIDGKKQPVIEWQALEYSGELECSYSHKGAYSSSTFSLAIKGFNKKPYYDISLGFSTKF